MKALVLKRYGKPGLIEFVELPRPVIKPDDILIRVHAVGLNPIDTMIPRGDFKAILTFSLPITLGSDVAGIVEEVGGLVTGFKVGDAVFASTFDLGAGTLAEFVAVPAHAVAHKPANLDFVEAASIPMVGLASWQALTQRAQVKPGHKVFIPAGSGGIGSFAIQLAKHLGATVGTTTSTVNVDLVRSLGADEVIDYKNQEFEKVLAGYDVVLGTVRGDGLDKALQIVQPGSTVVSLIGPPDAAFAQERGMNFVMKCVFGLLSRKIIARAHKRGASYSFLFVKSDGRQLANIGALLEAGLIRPVIDKVYPFAQAQQALAYLAAGRARGKVVVQIVAP